MARFYTRRIGMETWLQQDDCVILRHGNLLLGFCERPETDCAGTITFFYDSREDVDAMHGNLVDIATTQPATNDKYRIYQFFARDPEGRILEFQHFLHPVNPVA